MAIAGAEVGLSELLMSGVTTVLDYPQRVPAGWLDVLARSGLRGSCVNIVSAPCAAIESHAIDQASLL